MRKLFTPEFRNRLDAIVQFAPLERREILRVVDKFILQLEEQLSNKNVQLDVDESARLWIADRGYDAKMGARPMARIIQESLKRPLAEELLFGKLANGGRVHVQLGENDQLDRSEEHTSELQSLMLLSYAVLCLKKKTT